MAKCREMYQVESGEWGRKCGAMEEQHGEQVRRIEREGRRREDDLEQVCLSETRKIFS